MGNEFRVAVVAVEAPNMLMTAPLTRTKKGNHLVGNGGGGG